ncbi:MAG: GNAT family N-acetyltransferase [Proteobacteria bacterium]|nr:GNAT family N-acetyltransferase [Pseudomonadota bacterium]
MTATWPTPVTLSGKRVTLEPLRHDHHDGLVESARDGELWNLWYTSVPTPDGMRADIDRRLALQAAGSMLPFAIIANASGRIVGATSYMNIESESRRLEIGSTWYAASAQRSGINTQAKRLLLAHAFEELDCIAVEFRTHFFNRASRAAIERLGARLDGILRNHRRSADGSLRDTCVYSIIASEWPTVRIHLDHQLHKPRG